MNSTTKLLVIFVIVVHAMFFILEALFWMQPLVYNILLGYLNNAVSIDYPTQAQTLKNLFINQGCYNLFLTLVGVQGLLLFGKSQRVAGSTLILVLCFFGMGAGVVLTFSTKAYILAFLQAVPAAIAFARVYSLYKQAISAK